MDAAAVDAPPDAARRFLRHAIAEGAAAASAVLLRMAGQIRVGRWLPFQAVQVISSEANVWAARAGWRALPITGFDRFADGRGEMRWLLAGRIPLMRASGPDVDRSAAGRLAIEATIWLPTAFEALEWRAGSDPDTAVASRRIAGEEVTVDLHLDGDGRPRTVTMRRWANPNREPWSYYPFGGLLEEETTVGGITIPIAVRVGYWPGTERWGEGEFFRARIIDAAFL